MKRGALLLKKMQESAPSFSKELAKTIKNSPIEFNILSEIMCKWAENMIGDNYLDVLVRGYVKFVMDVNRSQLKYEVEGKYESKKYDEVFELAYNSQSFMNDYHWGVFVITFAWHHHLNLYSFFKKEFIDVYCQDCKNLIDLGTGSGVWHHLFLEDISDCQVTAVDISSTSIELSKKMASKIYSEKRVKYIVDDAMRYKGDIAYDIAMSCFLMEHLETPQNLLNNINRNLKTRGYAFVTVALTAAEYDHIYEFKSESEVILLAENAGFRVIKMFSSSPQTIVDNARFLPRSVALVLQKKANDIW